MGRFDLFFTDDESELPENAPIEVNGTLGEGHSSTGTPGVSPEATSIDPLLSQNEPETDESEPQTLLTEPESTTSTPDKPTAAFTLLSEDSSPEMDASASDANAVSVPATETTAALPAQIAERPQTAMRARFSGHALFNDVVRLDWQRAIAADPLAFDALLYVPTDASAAETDPDAGSDDEPAFTEINANQKTLSYSDPVLVAVLDCPDDRPEFTATDSDGETDGGVDDVMIIRVAPPLSVLEATSSDDDHPVSRAFVPVGSIIEWNEALANGSESRSWWYVHRIFTYGTASVGSLYYCIPARNFDAVTGDSND